MVHTPGEETTEHLVRVARRESGETRTRRVDYLVTAAPGATLLDALFQIKHHHDATLAFRASCRSAICGSCAIQVDGTNRLACKTQMAALGKIVRVEPLPGYPVCRDLIVDLTPFWAQYRAVQPTLLPRSPTPDAEYRQSPAERRILDAPAQCILCAACTAACPVAWTAPEFLGPAALLKAWRFVADSRDGARGLRLRALGDEMGLWRCHTIFRCGDACPKGLLPTEAIEHLRRAAWREAWGRGEARRGGA